MQPPTLFLTVGLPGTGKTTAARRIEAEHNAVRLTKDEWLTEAPHSTWSMSEEALVEWAEEFDIPTAAELDGSEPIDRPPDGFASWGAWMRHRWPPSVR
jgi:AAA domain